MSKHNDNGLSRMLYKALENSKAATKKAELRSDKKVWSNIQFPVSLSDGLGTLTKDELQFIRQRLELRGASSLKKAELIAVLEKEIPALIEKNCSQLDIERYKLLRKIIRSKGLLEAPDLSRKQINYLRETGMMFTGTYDGSRVVVIPEEISEVVSQLEDNLKLKSIVKRNTDWIKLTHGLLYYYGTLDFKELIGLLEKYMNEKINVSEYLSIIKDSATYHHEIRVYEQNIWNLQVRDREKVKHEQQMRVGLGYYPFSKEDLLNAGEPEFVERNDNYMQFVSFITKNYTIPKEDADSIAKECVNAIKIGEGPNEILQIVQNKLEVDSLEVLQAFMAEIVNLINNTREWFLKGYTPSELSSQERKSLQPLPSSKDNLVDFRTKKRIGRNDLCPCGSNKKFKKCCGK